MARRKPKMTDFDGFDWSPYEIGDLQRIADDIANEIQIKRDEKKKALLEQFHQMLTSEGLTLDDVIGTKRRRQRRRGTAPVKYRDPETGKTWSGRGRKPVWFAEKLNAGRTLEDFAVTSPPPEEPPHAEPEEGEEAA
jgi:DNA-binding protein H-NS